MSDYKKKRLHVANHMILGWICMNLHLCSTFYKFIDWVTVYSYIVQLIYRLCRPPIYRLVESCRLKAVIINSTFWYTSASFFSTLLSSLVLDQCVNKEHASMKTIMSIYIYSVQQRWIVEIRLKIDFYVFLVQSFLNYILCEHLLTCFQQTSTLLWMLTAPAQCEDL